MHANSGITFDLDKLRLAGESFDAVSGVAGLNWTYFGDPVADIEVWVLVDGVLKYHQFFKQNVRMYEAFTVSLPPDSHYLSLAATDYNGIPQDDHAVFADVALVRNP